MARAGFEAADAALRSAPRVGARQYLARADALRALGFASAADKDVRIAFRLGSSDPAVLAAVLAASSDTGLRAAAARAALADDRAGDAVVKRAAATLVEDGRDPLIHARREGSTLFGWVASRHGAPPRLWALAADGTRLPIELEFDGAHARPHGTWRWLTRDHAVHGAVRSIHAVSASGAAAALPVPEPERPSHPHRRVAEGRGTQPVAGVTVVVPVYGDPVSLSACLESLALQDAPDLSVVVVDDASPDPEVSRLAAAFCRGERRLYLRNPVNRGFAASVNTALARAPRTDMILLNSDVVLPADAIVRLSRAAHRAPDIGIASPLSNDAGNASFPDPLAPEAALPSADARRLDAAAGRVNAGVVVDLPSVHGPCLFIRRDCLDRTGPLSPAYGRGYYEDVDLCLRAREAGFRVVAACDVYVTHEGGRSFGPDRYPLIARNADVLDRRFPRHRAEDATHDRADPLRAARAVIEEAEPLLNTPTVLLVGRKAGQGALLDWRALEAEREGLEPLVLDCSTGWDGACCRLAGTGARAPRSLAFPLVGAGLGRLGTYLSRLPLSRIEVCGLEALPARLADWLFAADLAPIAVMDDDTLPDAALVSSPPDVAGPDTSAATRAPAAQPAWDPAPGSGASAGPATLAALLPEPCVHAERLLLALARRLRREPVGRLLILGTTAVAARLAAPGTAWVSGPMRLDEMTEALDHHAVDHVLLPYRDSLRWVWQAVPRGDRPAAWFGPTSAGARATSGDLALAPDEDDEAVSGRLVAWLAAGSAEKRR